MNPQNLQLNDFELFQILPAFEQNQSVLDQRWKELQRKYHPDQFATKDAATSRLAMQISARINQAYKRLKNPLQRAAYLCELNHEPILAESNTKMPTDFLIKQITWRETLDETQILSDLNILMNEVRNEQSQLFAQCQHLIDHLKDFKTCAQHVRALMFMDRFEKDIQNKIDQIMFD